MFYKFFSLWQSPGVVYLVFHFSLFPLYIISSVMGWNSEVDELRHRFVFIDYSKNCLSDWKWSFRLHLKIQPPSAKPIRTIFVCFSFDKIDFYQLYMDTI